MHLIKQNVPTISAVKPYTGKAISDHIIRDNPDVVVFGHTHRRFCEVIEGTLYLNPGYAGRPRPDLARSVALLHCDERGITTDFLKL